MDSKNKQSEKNLEPFGSSKALIFWISRKHFDKNIIGIDILTIQF
jgi:hypothetical protein